MDPKPPGKFRHYASAAGGASKRAGSAFFHGVAASVQVGVEKAIKASEPQKDDGTLRVRQVAAGMMLIVLIPLEFIVLPVIYTVLTGFSSIFGTGGIQTIVGSIVPMIMLGIIAIVAYLDYYFVRKGAPGILDKAMRQYQ